MGRMLGIWHFFHPLIYLSGFVLIYGFVLRVSPGLHAALRVVYDKLHESMRERQV